MSPDTLFTRHALTGQSLRLTFADGRVVSSEPTAEDPGDVYVAPPFCDIQINGARGVAFTSASLTTDGVRTVTAACQRHGIGQYLPTVITSDFETIRASFAALSRAVESDPDLAKAIPGFHLEGPYLSGDDGPRGAHPKRHTRDPDLDEFNRWQDAAGGRIKMVTVAPERAGAIAFIEALTKAGVIVAIGHTAADGETLSRAGDAGAKISTHLGNGCAGTMPRHDNPIWHQLADDRLFASVIADGHHLPPAVLKGIVRGKTPGRLVLTCDASPLAGLAPGRYREWESEFDVLPGGKIVVPGTPYLAGSGVFTDHCVSHILNAGLATMSEVIAMASVRPRELLGLAVPDDWMVFRWSPGNVLFPSPLGGEGNQSIGVRTESNNRRTPLGTSNPPA
jgi:N-acetylglucosamine-6-phosphate deacetylase